MQKKVTFAIVGAGDRAQKYMEFVRRNPMRAALVAIAEPNELRRRKMADEFGVAQEFCFESWEELFLKERLSDAVIISTPDHLHYTPAMAALEKGYHVLLEKPIAQSIEECLDIKRRASELGLVVGICYVLRYFPSYKRVKALIDSGAIGEIISINHREPVGIDRMIHGFVRGEWNDSERSNPMILAKSCHDLDLLFWLTNDTCRELSSFGSLRWFRAENAPNDSTERCLDCPIEKSCIFSAVDLYLRRRKWLRHFDDKSETYITELLRTSEYGLCVYRSNNNVVDNQVVSMLMKRGTVINFSMDAFTRDSERTTHIMGTKGEIKACENYFEHVDFESRTTSREDYSYLMGEDSFHSGADIEIMENFADSVSALDTKELMAGIDSAIESHRVAFEAEEKRKLIKN